MVNYANSSIYKLCCLDTNIKSIYVGSTTNFAKRKYKHKQACTNQNNRHYNYKCYQFIRDNGGWDNWQMVEIEKYNAVDKRDLLKRERYYYDILKADLNMVKMGCTIEDRREIGRRCYHKTGKPKQQARYQANKENILKRARELIKCTKCSKMVPRSEISRHNYRHHVPPVKCPKCNKTVNRAELARHNRKYHA